ncbi:MAG: hypothetical protein Q9M94_01830 [Candidatus Gracilibacteria bacterium]|nr:hypothetical protein [Candidatus Gracilibacteria bacterium]
MGLNDFSADIDGQDEDGISMGNVSEQISEVYKEEVKKGDARIKKTRKDENKAKQQDMLLAKFLVKILIDKKYDSLFPELFKSFDSGVPSNLILGILSLVYIEISNELRVSIEKKLINFSYVGENTIKFSGNNLPQEVKDRINLWVEDILDVIQLNPSKIYTKRIISSIKKSSELKEFTKKVLQYFLSEINIYMSDKTAGDYSSFIMNNIILPKIEKSK